MRSRLADEIGRLVRHHLGQEGEARAGRGHPVEPRQVGLDGGHRLDEPGQQAAIAAHLGDRRQRPVDVAIGHLVAEPVERHLGEQVDPRLLRRRLVAAVVQGQDLAPHRPARELDVERRRRHEDGGRRQPGDEQDC